MNKSELIDVIAEKANLSKVAAGNCLDAFLEAVSQAVSDGDSVTLVGFGTFKPLARNAREGKNPRTGEKLKIAATTVPKFTPGATFKARVAEKAAKKGKKK
ncbi:HU family DNA-binding protein [Chitinimonas sp. PSY-7]|uniref:HU family DNA-binding protein n=1 Tax=unclassified Chitinimonas TaxID=2637166 RepID=UPI000C111B31|nr:HU family DNA-binding protein [Chitinimonas sp. BJB300]PHV12560.1 DNA-binding protein HU [Chitinimonas sp. BJB300]TSJ90045.1 HU family DNA-binding protein [Chitinimonas sp. BJB300]